MPRVIDSQMATLRYMGSLPGDDAQYTQTALGSVGSPAGAFFEDVVPMF